MERNYEILNMKMNLLRHGVRCYCASTCSYQLHCPFRNDSEMNAITLTLYLKKSGSQSKSHTKSF